jgi:DNA primase
MTLSPQWLDELRSRITLSTLIGRHVKVQRAGREYKACCPFHNEKTPSFTINDDKGFYHCLAGETQVMLRTGRQPIAALAGQTQTVLAGNGQWVEALFDSFGEQRLWQITLRRNGVTKTLFATEDHRWFVRGRMSAITTGTLKPGARLESATPPCRTDWTLDPAGVRHGIVFGDGALYKGTYGTVNLHGDKDAELAPWFEDQKPVAKTRGEDAHYLRVYGGKAFGHMKGLPDLDQSEPYLLGFLAGYLAADGHVAKDGTVMLNSAHRPTLERVRDIATLLGITTYGVTTQRRSGFGAEPSELHRIHFVPSQMDQAMFLLSQARQRFAASSKKFARLRWTVISAEPSDRVETVYCAQVPVHHSFTLEDNILTGNCFGCGAHGDAIRFMTDHQGLGFMDAVKELAAEAGMSVPAPDPRAARQAEARASLHDVCQAAQDWFVAQLHSAAGEEARAYLKNRGLTAETIARFGIGFAPDSRTSIKSALGNLDEELLVEAGLLIKVDDKAPYDRFRGRVMIPIRDPRGRVIAFGGRILGAGEPKYLNSPDTPLFDKGRTLYNLHLAAPASRQTGRVVVVEGYMDVIALAQAGFGECVAPLGTALTEHQIERLWKMVDRPLLCFDGDNAGQKAAMRAATRALPLLKPGLSLGFVSLPGGQDPDDLVRASGPQAFAACLDQATGLLDHLWTHELNAAPLQSPEARAGLKARLNAHADTIADGDIKALYRREIGQRFSDLFFAARAPSPARPAQQRGGSGGGKGWQRRDEPVPPSEELRVFSRQPMSDLIVRGVITGLIHRPHLIARHSETLSEFVTLADRWAALLDALIDAAYTHASGALDPPALMTILQSKGLADAVDRLKTGGTPPFSFCSACTDPADQLREVRIAEDFAEAIEVMITRPRLEAALQDVTRRFENDMQDGLFLEQQQLRARKDAFDQRLIELAERS